MFVRCTWDHIKIDDHVNVPSARAMTLPAFVRCMGDWTEGARYKTVRRETDIYCLLYSVDGTGIVSHRGREIRLDPGQICLIDGMEPHEYATAPDCVWHSIWFHICGGVVASCCALLNPGDALCATNLYDTTAVQTLYRSLIPHLNSNRLEDELAVSQLVTNFLFRVLLAAQAQRPDPQDSPPAKAHYPQYVLDAVAYIKEHYGQAVRIRDIVRDSYVSKPVFIREFKRYTGMRPMEYLMSVRMKTGMNLCRDTFASVTDIAQSCGYTSSSLFTKHFKEWTGMTPTEYRRSHRRNQ